ncbi:uncharacterized protein N0V89_011067 [Didymosphaeria variabile]|uniref:Kelch repeat protein-like protein n=1 Tax=Didymosphaeria variabile TaxID=1932322 RepID=A0A9W8XE23_9PLEO|nr:uncharacterized protein N0V89_011067 [Didymosphaeria variabile]KAJ4347129.1 hypothetical protein N0V89_011067 [Didymosphaeria variabile]
MEVGLVDEEQVRSERSPAPSIIKHATQRHLRPARAVRFRSKDSIFELKDAIAQSDDGWETDTDSDEDDTIPRIQPQQNAMSQKVYRLGMLTVLLALMLPILQMCSMSPQGVRAGVIPQTSIEPTVSRLDRRDSSTDVCKRWAGQSAVVNGTLYMYGFRTSNDSQQKSDTWTNDFLSLDLTKSWQVAGPSLTSLSQPSGPPAVSLGYLWNSLSSLYLYGGEFSEEPVESPTANSLWEYKISSKEWVEHKDPKSSAGDNAEDAGQSIQRAAEGSGFSVAVLGRGWYFGGHEDYLTTKDWSNQVGRIYLKSLLEFTFPGYSNNAVDDLKDGKTAGEDGVYRNITEGGLQSSGSFPERADGVLVYIPGFGAEGTLIGVTGGDNDTFAQMNVIDVYDIANSTWYKQNTAGKTPNGSSYNVYMYGGQSLQPAGNQEQYDDMWILSVPSFTWIEVDPDTSKSSSPPARAGHSCHVWDSQMIVLGGYTDPELGCDTPGIYAFNMSSLGWSDQFTALTGDKALKAYNGNEGDEGNPLGQQANQRGFDHKAGLEGSYGYSVPKEVQSVIGGKETGGATLTAPVQTPTDGPYKSGTPQTYTVTGPNGAIITQTVSSGNDNSSANKANKIGAIVGGVLAGVFFFVAAYFAFCAWIYRKQVAIWKEHAAMVTARSNAEKNGAMGGGAGAAFLGSAIASSGKNSTERAQRDGLGTSGSGTASAIRTSNERTGTSYTGAAGVAGAGGVDALGRRTSVLSSTDDLLDGQEPAFWGDAGCVVESEEEFEGH